MSFSKFKYLKPKKEVVVTFIDDNNVKCIISTVNDLKNGKLLRNKCVKASTSGQGNASTSSPARKIIKKTNNKAINCVDSDSDEESCVDKPLALFEDGDVPGKAVFGFHTPKRKSAMTEKAVESAEKRTPLSSCASPRTPGSNTKKFGFSSRVRRSIALNLNSEFDKEKLLSNQQPTDSVESPRSRSYKKNEPERINKKNESVRASIKQKFESVEPKTPYSLRASLKRKIVAHVERTLKDVDSDDSEDYVPSDLEDDDDDNESSENSEESNDEDSTNSDVKNSYMPCNIRKRDPIKFLSNTPTQKCKQKDMIYTITADEYFNSNSEKKNKTSNHTLNKLKNPRLEQDQLNKLLGSINNKSTHRSALEALQKENCTDDLFEKWCFCLKEGYSILLFGLGSKHKILNTFHQKVLSNNHVLVINGFFPGLSIKEIVDSLAGELLDVKDIPSRAHEVIELIDRKLSSSTTPPVFLIVHNLDGVMLRTDKAQGFLARLASIPKCHLLASVDHINAPLLWDDKKLSEYNFIWEDVTSFNIYAEETSFENSLLVQRSGTVALASLKNVYQSLTRNGKEIFKILLNDCLENKKISKYIGIGFSDLYWRCRDNFLVSTDLALRSQLTEFLDHQLVKWRKDSDHLVVPVDTNVLEQFKELLDNADE